MFADESPSYDSDLEQDDEVDKSIKSRTDVKVRVDQYLTTCDLGRLALKAGDAQLAKDRFNFAMDLELLSEIESTNDFGVTGGLLREELISRNKSKTVNQLMDVSDKRLKSTLSKLQKVFIEADEKAAFNTADEDAFLSMGAALSMIGELEKAETVYKEGIAASPRGKCPKLLEAMQRLDKLKDMMSLVSYAQQPLVPQNIKQQSTESITLHFPKKTKRPHIKSVLFEDPVGGVPRSRSFSSDFIDSNTSSVPGSPVREKPPLSPLVGVGRHSPITRRKSTLSRLFKKDKKRPKSVLFNLSPSHSMEDLTETFDPEGIWRKRSTWKSLFEFDRIKESLKGFDSRTIHTMRVMHCFRSHATTERKRYWY